MLRLTIPPPRANQPLFLEMWAKVLERYVRRRDNGVASLTREGGEGRGRKPCKHSWRMGWGRLGGSQALAHQRLAAGFWNMNEAYTIGIVRNPSRILWRVAVAPGLIVSFRSTRMQVLMCIVQPSVQLTAFPTCPNPKSSLSVPRLLLH